MSTDVAMETLFSVDPEFEVLCDLLYGPEVSRQAIYEDVFGISKAAPQQQTGLLHRFGLAATLAGAGLGVGELAEAGAKGGMGSTVKNTLTSDAGQKIIKPLATLKKPKVAAGLAGTMLAGDAAASYELKRSNGQVNKGLVVRGAKALGRGAKSFGSGMREGFIRPEKHEVTLARHNSVPHAPLGAAQRKQMERGQTQGAAVRHPIRAAKKSPRAAVIGGAAVGGGAAHEMSKSFVAEGTFSKFDDDKRLAFGWASVVQKDGLPVVDRQGDYITPDDLEDAAYRYVLACRVGGDMHRRAGESPHHVSDLVESFVVTPEKIAKMGLPPETPVGWWVGFKVNDDDTWHEVKKGGRTGFSIHGKGKRVDTSMDELVGR